MIGESIASKSVKFVCRDLIFDLLSWPIWWYSVGLKKALARMSDTIAQGNAELGVTIWIKNLFKPMFGQYDWQGRLISFFVRLVQIIGRTILLCFWIIFSFVIFLFWLLLPIFLFIQVLFNLGLWGNELW